MSRRFVNTFSATIATISTIWASVYPSGLDRLQIGVGDVAARPGDFRGKRHRDIRLGVRGRALTVQSDLRFVDLGEVQTEIAVGRQAIVTTVDLGDSQRNSLAGPDVECLAERAARAEVALQGRRAQRHEAKEVGNYAELFLDRCQHRLGGGGKASRAGMAMRDILGSPWFDPAAPASCVTYDHPRRAIIREVDKSLLLFQQWWMDSLDAMRIYVAVAKLGSFAKAARQLRLSPSVVTRSIAQLEDQLGVALLTRTTRAVRLTERGEIYLESCQQIMEDIVGAERKVRGENAEPRGDLKVAAPIASAVSMCCRSSTGC